MGVEVVEQVSWLSKAATLRMPFDHFAADVADSIANEAYPDGIPALRAVAATRVPWFARHHGETDDQRDCRSIRDATTVAELSDVYLWCQHAALVEAVLHADDPAAELEGLTVESPMTAALSSGTETGSVTRA